jgi:prepilin-type N-terminal cleavage/methylation domain-containing protein
MNDRGFTLIELLIVVVVMGILATIALPRLGQTRERAYVASMQSDLRQLILAQELYYPNNDFSYFTGDPVSDDFPFSPSEGVTIELSSQNPSRGFSAEATHNRVTVMCTVSVEEGAASGRVQCSESQGQE